MQVNLKAHTAFQLAQVEPLQMELSDCQQGSHQLLNFPTGVIGGPHNNAYWCMETSGLTLQVEMAPPTISGSHDMHPLSAPTYGALSPTTHPSMQVSAAFSAFSLQVHHTSDHSLQVQGANGHTSKPPSPIDHCK